MIKKLIFDVDNTLIPFPKSFVSGFGHILEKFEIDLTPVDLYNLIGEYELEHDTYDYDLLLSYINRKLNTNFDSFFLKYFMDMYNNLEMKLEKGTKETMEYLSSKYDIVVLTNWFTDSQEQRLERVGLLKYIDKVYGADVVPLKPTSEAFKIAAGNTKLKECAMIGDSILLDMEPAYKLKMKTFCLVDTDKYTKINSISDLKELL